MSTNRIPGSFDIGGSVADGNYDITDMDTAYERAYINIRFFDVNGDSATPGAGTVAIQASPDGEHFYNVLNGAFNAADAYLVTRSTPYFEGPAVSIRVTLAGVTVATGFRATAQRY